MTRPRLLDLFCGAGGASMGYHRAGFEVVGVDLRAQPRYPFEFHQADAMAFPLEGFDAIHASPPCQRYSHLTRTRHKSRVKDHPDLVVPTRERLEAAGVPWVIENVVGSPLSGIVLCGSSFGLGVRRHRVFEASFGMLAPECRHAEQGRAVPVYGHTGSGANRGGEARHGRKNGIAEWREAMGIDWMTVAEIVEAIPPAYTEWIGRWLIEQLGRAT